MTRIPQSPSTPSPIASPELNSLDQALLAPTRKKIDLLRKHLNKLNDLPFTVSLTCRLLSLAQAVLSAIALPFKTLSIVLQSLSSQPSDERSRVLKATNWAYSYCTMNIHAHSIPLGIAQTLMPNRFLPPRFWGTQADAAMMKFLYPSV